MNVCRRILRGNLATTPSARSHKRAGASVKNGELLRLIADSRKFDAFVTIDKNLSHQQKLDALPFVIIVIRAKSNRLADLKPVARELLRHLDEFQPGHVYFLSEAGQ